MQTEAITDSVCGVDTIALVFSVESLSARGWKQLPGRYHLGVRAGRARVEASVATRSFTNNIRPLPLEDLELAAADLLAEVSTVIEPARDATLAKNVTVARIDLVRDFQHVMDVGAVLRSLAAVPRNPTLRLSLFGTAASPQTLTVGTKTTWRCTLYDKHEETRGRAPRGQLRFEARLRADRLRTTWAARHGGKVLVLADAHPSKLESLARASFVNASFDCSIRTPDELLDIAAGMTDLGMSSRYVLGAHLLRQATGRPCILPRASRTRYDALARNALRTTESSSAVHLDWERGVLA